jgi:hypothetical protein
MTDLEAMYAELRGEGMGHGKAISRLARRIGVDRATVQRGLDRAKTDQAKRRSQPER